MRFKTLERSPTLSEEIVEHLSRALAEGKLQPGDRLPSEQELAADFGVARTVVREAISQLKHDGFVRSRKGVGAFIAQPEERSSFRISPQCFEKRKELLKLMRLRTGVAAETAADAATSRSQEDLDAMQDIVKEMRLAIEDETNGAARYFEAERQLAKAFGVASGNDHSLAFLAMLDGQIAEKLRSVAVKNTRARELAASVVAEHERIVDAISQGDSATAREEARRHYEAAANRLADRSDLADV